MSFAAGVKEELSGLPFGNACCLLAELAGLTLAAGSMHLAGGGVQVEISTESPATARRVYRMIRALYDARSRIEQHERHRFHRNFSYRVVLQDTDKADRMLRDIGVLGGGEVDIGIKPELVRLSCCQGAFLRGLFLGCGSMSDPGKGYHLEMVLNDEQLARSTASMLIGADIAARVVERSGKHVVYIKEADHLSEFLVLVGAHAQMLRLEGIRVEKNVRNSVNRVVNCDTANMEKAVAAAGRQAEAIEVIERSMGLSGLPKSLRETAEARLENPDATLEQLAEQMGVSKSGLNHRFRKLAELALDISNREGNGHEPEDIDHQQR